MLPHRLLALSLLVAAPAAVRAGNWPQWRGPNGNSVSDEANLPVKWGEDNGIVWKCPLPEFGVSQPTIWGDAIFLTAQDGEKLLLLKINKKDGKIEWTREVGVGGPVLRGVPRRKDRNFPFNNLHNMASPTPATDGEHVVVHFGNGDLAAYDFAGRQLWKRNLEKDHGPYTVWWGHANSPVLWKDLVISVCMQDSLADLQKEPSTSYVVAHDKRTGEQKWKTLRMTGATQEDCDSYTTPIFHTVGDRVEMIIMGGNQLDAYDPATGKQLWFFKGIQGSRTITGPTLGGDVAYAVAGKRKPAFALKLGGTGELPDKAVRWQHKDNTPDSPCPVLYKGLLFWVTDNDGFAVCLDAATGELKWKERLTGDHKASPLAGDGKVYFLGRSGTCAVVAASDKFQKLAENKLDDETTASMAVSDGRLYIRGKKALYCIGR
jgi:outer membrane protein assembly factor BamB